MSVSKVAREIDWVLVVAATAIAVFGIITMKSFGGSSTLLGVNDYFFSRQLWWLGIGFGVFLGALWIDWSFLKTNSIFLLLLYAGVVGALLILVITGSVIRGVASWYRVYSISIEPVEIMKFVLLLLLAKYFSKRHVEIARFRHIVISGFYAGIPAILVLAQPDFGSAMVLGALWIGMAFVGGIRFKHVALLVAGGAAIFFLLWTFALAPYQKSRITSFLSPESDVLGSGYHAQQSVIAVGSGGVLGKGIGFGTQSRLEFLPEHETDFIFAAFAEEWGLVGVALLFLFLGILLWRILRAGVYAESNFEKLYAAGLGIVLFAQSAIHIGMNVGMLPITGLGLPFLSYGGSSMVSMFLALGILQSFSIHKKGIFLGTEDRYREGVV